LEALRRELREELEFGLGNAEPFAQFDFDLSSIGLERDYRSYYEVLLSRAAFRRLVLHEGSEMRALDGDEALMLPRICPYDAFALFLHYRRVRLIGSKYGPPAVDST
jgi:8-oxo-dGTP pyrophosphatase MutT (NUDIX family)